MMNIFFSSIVLTLLGILGSFYFKFLVDDILTYGIEKTLHIISIGMIILSIFKIVLNGFRSHLLLYLSQNIDIPLMLGYYSHVIQLPMNFFWYKGSRRNYI